jgi:hypothetical protein
VRRLNRLAEALGCRGCLEIGVCEGTTLLGVNVANRTGVDPRFAFDWRGWHGRDGIELHECSSYVVFSCLNPSTQYGLTFVDDLHTFEQAYRDIPHAFRHAHPRTLIAIDDTVPSDVFSTCRSMEEALSLRHQLSSVDDDRWHGDACKVVPLLNAFHPDL